MEVAKNTKKHSKCVSVFRVSLLSLGPPAELPEPETLDDKYFSVLALQTITQHTIAHYNLTHITNLYVLQRITT